MDCASHSKILEGLCRICSRKLDKNRECKKAVLYKDILFKYFDVNVDEDKGNIHPNRVCERCRKVLFKINKTSDTMYHPQLNFATFKEHEENCALCDRFSGSKSKRAGRPLKSWSNQHNISTNSKVTPDNNNNEFQIEHNCSVPASKFNQDAIIKHSQELGFAYIPTDSFMSFVLFYKQKDVMELENLVTLNIEHTSHNWKLLVGNVDVTSHILFSSIETSLTTTDSAFNLLDKCSNLKFCPGSPDFLKLCLVRRKENLAVFRDQKNCIVAQESIDVVSKSLGLSSTIRHMKCAIVTDGKRCNECTKYRYTLHSMQKRIMSPETEPDLTHSRINNRYLSDNGKLSKLESQSKKVHTLSSENAMLKKRIEFLIEEYGVTTEENLSKTLGKSMVELESKAINDFPEGSSINLLFNEQLKQSKCKTAKQMRWHPIMIRWCLGLYYTSPAAYEFIRNSGFLRLPHKTTVLDYSLYTKPETGFNPDTIRKLYEEAGVENLHENQRNVALLFDEMKIHSELVYSKSTGKLIGFVELGAINSEFELLEKQFKAEQSDSNESEERELATHSLAFLVRGIYTDFQFCMGCFAAKDLKAEDIFPVAWEAVSVLESIGFIVRCLVSDGASANRSFYKLHRTSSSALPYFAKNLCCGERILYFICDVPHLIKTTRNNLENSHGHSNTKNLLVHILISL